MFRRNISPASSRSKSINLFIADFLLAYSSTPNIKSMYYSKPTLRFYRTTQLYNLSWHCSDVEWMFKTGPSVCFTWRHSGEANRRCHKMSPFRSSLLQAKCVLFSYKTSVSNLSCLTWSESVPFSDVIPQHQSNFLRFLFLFVSQFWNKTI